MSLVNGHIRLHLKGPSIFTDPLEYDLFPGLKKMDLFQGDKVSFNLKFTEKDEFIWQYRIEQNGNKEVFTQLSAFGLPSLRDLTREKEDERSHK